MSNETRAELHWQLSEAKQRIRQLEAELDREKRKTERAITKRVATQRKGEDWRSFL